MTSDEPNGEFPTLPARFPISDNRQKRVHAWIVSACVSLSRAIRSTPTEQSSAPSSDSLGQSGRQQDDTERTK